MASSHETHPAPIGNDGEQANRYRVDLTSLLPDGPDIARGVIIGSFAFTQGLPPGMSTALGVMAAIPGQRSRS
ncbi:hypothetical protein PV749_02245 [Streptomyces sp. ID03-2B]|uniref:Uncharacterized protein n=1 Tax=Streptomyces caviscabies TaxID=90079 RepID=A0ABW2MDY2_9ACTN|nr:MULTISPECIES: hypothetical protein [unclassified Streptomyces]MDX3506473.1 hypothetical protein [Streptomyces sp. ATCC51928]MDX3589950.1 hypothetical protein [Streptomyces sp. ID03-2B]MDX5522320.1 hypothetical protein [Streptomyces sp. DE06-01C]